VPGVLAFFGFIPVIGTLLGIVAWIWALITAIVAIRETLIISTGRAIVVGLVALIASGIVIGILSLIFGVGWGVV
jgi:hypothetical protein